MIVAPLPRHEHVLTTCEAGQSSKNGNAKEGAMFESIETRRRFFERILLESRANGKWGKGQIEAAKSLLAALDRDDEAVDVKKAAGNDYETN